MSERFTRLFALPQNLYTETSPVVIAAGALLRDNQSGKVLAQLKLRSIDAKEIKAVRVSISPFDTAGAPLGEAAEYQYLDLAAKRGEEFGAKSPIVLPNAVTRAFSVSVTEVIFVDNSIWRASGAPWETLPVPQPLDDALGDAELVRQYHLTFGRDCACLPMEHRDLWYCHCGARNRREEAVCHRCGREHAAVGAVDLDALRAECDARLAAERAAAEEKARAEAAAAAARAKRTKRTLTVVALLLALSAAAYFAVTQIIIPNGKYNDAVALMNAGQYSDAISAFEGLNGYKDSAEQIEECQTAILDGQYAAAVALMDAGQYNDAIFAFSALNGYKDSSAQIVECKAELLKNPVIGESVYFGSYEQDNNTLNGKEQIEWLVLDIQDGKALLISKYALDCKHYNEKFEEVTWETCTLREWLNNDFLSAAFSATEQAMIPTVKVSADKNPDYKTDPGKATRDKVFLLSIEEADKYFASDSDRTCKPTNYAEACGANINDPTFITYGCWWWWLRSPGDDQDQAATVRPGGIIGTGGVFVDGVDNIYFSYTCAVRPAIWINLGS